MHKGPAGLIKGKCGLYMHFNYHGNSTVPSELPGSGLGSGLGSGMWAMAMTLYKRAPRHNLTTSSTPQASFLPHPTKQTVPKPIN